MRNNLFVVVCIVSMIFLNSGCVLIALPAGLIGQGIKEKNQECDDIIVKYSYKYHAYLKECKNNNQSPKKFSEWMETQVKSEKEKKALKRYIKLQKE